MKIYCDNMWAVLFTKNNRRSDASRLMDIKYLKVKKMLRDDVIQIEHIGTFDMVAHPWTKVLHVTGFNRQLGMFRELDYSHHSICFECGSKVLWFHLIQIHVINIMVF